MKQSIVLKGFVCALVVLPLAAGCKKKEGATEGSAAATGSATATAGSGSAVVVATGSGSAAEAGSAAAGSAAAGSAAAPTDPATPWAKDTAVIEPNSKVTGKKDGGDWGTFDRALFFRVTDKYGETKAQLHIAQNCEKFSCAHYESIRGGVYSADSLNTDCPNAKTMDINFVSEEDQYTDAKQGAVLLDVSLNGPMSGGQLSGKGMKGSTLTAVSDKEVKGKIKVKEDKSEAAGEFVAKNCGTMVFPKM
jgi:hypothetical protein